MHVVLADPPAFTPQYDRALAAALAGAGAEVDLVTSRFRYGELPEPAGYRVREWFYPVSSGIDASRLRIALKTLEHPVGMARLAALRPDVLHVQWLTAPEADRWLLRARAPLVLTAHDLLPRRTGHKESLWRQVFARFDRVVVHSENGKRALAEFGISPDRLRVIQHPVFRHHVERADDGRTVLALGIIRPYKGLDDAVTAVLSVEGARLLVAGDPRIALGELQNRAGDRAEWRLGYLPDGELARTLGEATVAVFPYRAELDQSGALLQALGAGVPAVVYDVGGLGELVEAFGAGRVVPAGDVQALAAALAELLARPDDLASARAGAERAREELTWEASAAAHLELYAELA